MRYMPLLWLSFIAIFNPILYYGVLHFHYYKITAIIGLVGSTVAVLYPHRPARNGFELIVFRMITESGGEFFFIIIFHLFSFSYIRLFLPFYLSSPFRSYILLSSVFLSEPQWRYLWSYLYL